MAASFYRRRRATAGLAEQNSSAIKLDGVAPEIGSSDPSVKLGHRLRLLLRGCDSRQPPVWTFRGGAGAHGVMAMREVERAYVRGLARDLTHFPPAIVDEKIAYAVYHAFGHSLDVQMIHKWIRPRAQAGSDLVDIL
jgi:hypothetical protein